MTRRNIWLQLKHFIKKNKNKKNPLLVWIWTENCCLSFAYISIIVKWSIFWQQYSTNGNLNPARLRTQILPLFFIFLSICTLCILLLSSRRDSRCEELLRQWNEGCNMSVFRNCWKCIRPGNNSETVYKNHHLPWSGRKLTWQRQIQTDCLKIWPQKPGKKKKKRSWEKQTLMPTTSFPMKP